MVCRAVKKAAKAGLLTYSSGMGRQRWGLMILLCVLAYLLGSVPTAYLFGKWKKGIDIRQYGSGNVGATNAFRVLGKLPGVLVLVIDVTKGVLAVSLLPQFVKAVVPFDSSWIVAILGMLAIAGHIWTPFLKFQGGKGVATSLGVFMAMDPFSTLIALTVWILVLALFRYVSVSSITAAITLPIVMGLWLRPFPWVLIASTSCFIICYRHKVNVQRLLVGSEKKIG